MVDTDPSVITLQADDDSYQAQSNAEADGPITPGQLIENAGTDTTGANDVDLFQRVSTSAEKVAVRVALAYVNTGLTIDDDYADGDSLRYRSFESGDQFYGLVFDGSNAAGTGTDLSANATITKGDRLVVYAGAGENGNLRALDTANGDDEAAALVEAKEDVDNSTGTTPARIEVEVL
jgi:hypothetical protein